MASFTSPLPHFENRRLAGLFAGLGLTAAAWVLPAAPARADTLIEGQFLGQASAIEAQALVGPLSVGLATSSHETCPCAGTNGHIQRNSLSILNVGAGTIAVAKENTSTAYGLKTATTATTQQTTKISKLSLLGGLITADSIKAVADVTATPDTLVPDYKGSRITNLVIAGTKIPVNVPANTPIDLPGIGSVTVKFVNQAVYGSQSAGIEVEMLRVSVNTTNSLGLPVGAVIVVGEAYAGYDRTQPAASLGGYAETLSVTANAGDLLNAAAAAGAISAIPGCSGTNGQTLTDTVATLNAGALLSLQAATTTAFGGPSGKGQVAVTTSQLTSVSLLGGLITANAITAVAQETRVGHRSIPSSLGSTFGSLVVAGVQIAENVPPNTQLGLPGVGVVVLNEQPTSIDGHIQVNGLHIVVGESNSLGLPIGAEIFVGHAEATATAF